MKNTLNNIFDQAKSSEIENLINKSPVPEISADTLCSIKSKVYNKTGIEKAKKKSPIVIHWRPFAAIMVCLVLIVGIVFCSPAITKILTKNNQPNGIINTPSSQMGSSSNENSSNKEVESEYFILIDPVESSQNTSHNETSSTSTETSIPSNENTVSSSSSNSSSTVPQSSKVDSVVSSTSNITNSSSLVTEESSQNEQYMPPDEPRVLEKRFDTVDSLVEWLESDKVLSQNESILNDLSETYKKTGLLVPKSSFDIFGIWVLCDRYTTVQNAIDYNYRNLSKNISIVGIQIFQQTEKQKTYRNEGIVSYRKQVSKWIFDEEILTKDYNGNDRIILYKASKLTFDNKEVECVEIKETSKYLNMYVYELFIDDFRVSISIQGNFEEAKTDFREIFKQFSFEKISIN